MSLTDLALSVQGAHLQIKLLSWNEIKVCLFSLVEVCDHNRMFQPNILVALTDASAM